MTSSRRLKRDPQHRDIPVIMISALSELDSIVRCIEAGADDYLAKPFDPTLLRARVGASLERKHLHDQVVAQAAELAAQAAELAVWNKTLEQRVADQLGEIERMSGLKRFLSPKVAELILSSGNENALESHRRDVTVVFCDLRGFTAFTETAEPEEVMGVLRDYHECLGELIHEFEGTVERFAGDGIMIMFNDPIPIPEPSHRAVAMAMKVRERVAELSVKWRKAGHELGFGMGIARGYATLGRIGFERTLRLRGKAIGTVTNLRRASAPSAQERADSESTARYRQASEVDRSDSAARRYLEPANLLLAEMRTVPMPNASRPTDMKSSV